MCKSKDIQTVISPGGHFKILDKELSKFLKNEDYVSKEMYDAVIRENEKLKTLLNQFKVYINNAPI